MRFMVLRRSKRSRIGLESIVFETFGHRREALFCARVLVRGGR
jgi:hypothetical protein